MTTLTPEQRALGRENANTVLEGLNRRDFLKAAAVAPVAGAFLYGYAPKIDQPVRAAIIGVGNEGRGAMIRDSNPEYIKFIGMHDIRPSNLQLAVEEFEKHAGYTKDDIETIKKNTYPTLDAVLDDPNVEVVVIALPLWLHAPVAVAAMRKGKHVFTEKLMAHSIGECKAMIRVARDTNRLLAVGHQRHYSALYDNANFLIEQGLLGDIRHIKALWHRNNAVPRIKKDPDGNLIYGSDGMPEYEKDPDGNIVYFDSWKPGVPADDEKIPAEALTLTVENSKGKKFTYAYDDIKQLVQWRLFNKTGAGLMAELGSHQLDACSIFLGKVHPIAVSGVGGTFFYDDKREVDDHVFVTFEFPAPEGAEEKDHVVVTYSSINTNNFENYGEQVYGTKATMVVEGEKDLLLYRQIDPNTWRPKDPAPRDTKVTLESHKGGKPALATSPSLAGSSGPAVGATGGDYAPSRGYREELEHFAYCVRNNKSDRVYEVEDPKLLPRCRGQVALADAVIALTSNIAMKKKQRIEFDPSWFDFESDATPDDSAGDLELGA
jgi:predicted dehydrogenase